MITREQYQAAVERAAGMLEKAGIVLTPKELERLEVADFGLNELEKTGLEIITYVNTERVCAKEIIMFPHQTCPEHWHPTVGSKLGKEETFRCRWGTVYLYIPGSQPAIPRAYRQPGRKLTTPSGMRRCLNPGSNIHCARIRDTGSRPERKGLSCPNSRRAAPMTKIALPILASGVRLKFRATDMAVQRSCAAYARIPE